MGRAISPQNWKAVMLVRDVVNGAPIRRESVTALLEASTGNDNNFSARFGNGPEPRYVLGITQKELVGMVRDVRSENPEIGIYVGQVGGHPWRH